MKPVDSHCHLDFERFDDDREEVIQRCRENLEFVVNSGCNYSRNQKSIELEKKFPDTVIATLGLHPTHDSSFDEIEKVKAQIREEDPVAVGEIGLDHHHVKSSEKRSKQKKVFKELLKLAEELEKPVVVHSREAEKETVETVLEYDIPEIMLHCFNGSPELAEKAAENGMKIGVTTQVLYSSRVQEIAEKIKLENILLETDSPFLYRGERNEPVNVLESAEKIAELKNTGKEAVIRRTTLNSRKIFKT